MSRRINKLKFRFIFVALAQVVILGAISVTPAFATGQDQAIVNAAASQSGMAYCGDGGDTSGPTHGTGGSGCGTGVVGFDCSGLALYAVYQGTGIVLPHGHGMESAPGGQLIAEANLQPGDLVFFGGGSLANFEHVGIYAGNRMMWDANDYNVPVQQHSLDWEESALTFDGGVRYWTTGVPPITYPGIGGGNASSWSAGRLDGWIAQDPPSNGSNLGHIYVDSTWHPWETINIPNAQLMTSQPAVVSWGVNRIDVFARGQAGDLIHSWLDGGVWNGWESLGGCIIGAPTATTWGVNRLDILAEGCNTTGPNLYHIWLDSVWHPWEQITSITQPMASAPSAVSWGPGRIDIFARGTDTSLLHTWVDSNWHDWESLGGCIIGAPAVASWGPQRLDAFAQSCNTTGGNFVHIWFDGAWHPFELLPTSNDSNRISGVLGADSWGNGRIDMFTRSSTNSLVHWWLDGAWNGPEDKGGSIASF